MKKSLLSLVLISLFFVSCETTENPDAAGVNNPELTKLQDENKRLKNELAEKDSTVNEFFNAMNEIEDNLVAIYEKEGTIAMSRMQDVELAGDSKTRITEEINAINELMAENKKKIGRLYKRLETAKGDISQFKGQLEQMEGLLASRDEEINTLRDELGDMNIEMDMLYTENEDLVRELDWQEAEMNTAFYAYGTSKELQEAGVLSKEGGFIGIGKNKVLSADFNKEYFTRIDITETNLIELNAQKVELLTSHPSNSYEWGGSDPINSLHITSPQEFWSTSKYLVIVVD